MRENGFEKLVLGGAIAAGIFMLLRHPPKPLVAEDVPAAELDEPESSGKALAVLITTESDGFNLTDEMVAKIYHMRDSGRPSFHEEIRGPKNFRAWLDELSIELERFSFLFYTDSETMFIHADIARRLIREELGIIEFSYQEWPDE